MSPENLVTQTPSLQLFFHEKIKEAFNHQKIEADEHISFYLMNLLTHFSQSDKIHKNDEGTETPLAILFYQAQQSSDQDKGRTLKYLGDFSLFVAGFFQDSFLRKIIDIDYYIGMGEIAYRELSYAGLFKNQQALFSMIFSELGSRFIQWVDVLSEVSEKTQFQTPSDLLRLYEKFLKTGSERMKQQLIVQGIFPSSDWKSPYSH